MYCARGAQGVTHFFHAMLVCLHRIFNGFHVRHLIQRLFYRELDVDLARTHRFLCRRMLVPPEYVCQAAKAPKNGQDGNNNGDHSQRMAATDI